MSASSLSIIDIDAQSFLAGRFDACFASLDELPFRSF